jgi:hypothetical protein
MDQGSKHLSSEERGVIFSEPKHVRAGWPTYCGCGSVFSWFGGGTTWLEYPL